MVRKTVLWEEVMATSLQQTTAKEGRLADSPNFQWAILNRQIKDGLGGDGDSLKFGHFPWDSYCDSGLTGLCWSDCGEPCVILIRQEGIVLPASNWGLPTHSV